ncbi:hypothetical protein [Maribacter sp. 2307UL18-2]|uniref:hypothetical protein n=1 Tax=Maribacter sp. 2307UL18-2 TaxID=3386274 RepID=UPI0039BD7590
MKTKNDKKSAKKSYDSEISKSDINALGKKGLSMDKDDDRLLQNRNEGIDFSGKDLDVPGRDNVNLTSSAGIVDEENSLFGQGSEHNENLEAPERANTPKD